LTPLFSPWRLDRTYLLQIYVDDIIFGSTNQDFVKSLERWWLKSFWCPWLESWVTSLDFKSSNWKMVHLWVKASASKTCSRSLEWMMPRQLAHQWEQMEIWIVCKWQHGGSKVVSLYDWKPTLCNRIKAGCHV
jgi:hypothetical protein